MKHSGFDCWCGPIKLDERSVLHRIDAEFDCTIIDRAVTIFMDLPPEIQLKSEEFAWFKNELDEHMQRAIFSLIQHRRQVKLNA